MQTILVDDTEYMLECTCGACPEQYDVFQNGEQVGYLRLRHGRFYAVVPDVCGDIVFEANPDGDGCFYDHERDYFLTKAVREIHFNKEK